MRTNYLILTITLLIITHFSDNVSAHPGWGIVFDSYGNLYFTDIINTTIWKLDTHNELTEFSKDKWSHQIIIDKEDNIYLCNEEFKMGNGWNSVLKISNDGSESYIIPPTKYGAEFSGTLIAIDYEQNIYYEFEESIYKRTLDGKYFLYYKDEIKRIRNLQWYNNSLLVVGRDKIIKVNENNETTVLAQNFISPSPTDGAYGGRFNWATGIDFDEKGCLYIAYYGNSRVLKVDREGNIEEIYFSNGNWYPMGVKYYNGNLFVLEEGHESLDGPTALRVIKISEDGRIHAIVSLGHIGGKSVNSHKIGK